jgi:hypothetical protein
MSWSKNNPDCEHNMCVYEVALAGMGLFHPSVLAVATVQDLSLAAAVNRKPRVK